VICCALLGTAIGMGGEMAQAQAKSAQNAVLDLDHGWQFRQITAAAQPSEYGWLPATVPGDVHLDLLANKKIPDPFYPGQRGQAAMDRKRGLGVQGEL
jgi:hypothetical protein